MTSHAQSNNSPIDNLMSALRAYLLEEKDVRLPHIDDDGKLGQLSVLVEDLRARHAKLSQQNEMQTVGEGEVELSRRTELARFSNVFDESVGQLTRNLLKSGEEGSQATQAVISSVGEVVEASNEIGTTIQDVVTKANESELSVKNACQSAESAIEVTSVVQSEAGNVVGLADLIERIAFQTNILAINASIEAARAGEAGRGFSVVASEVKNLSANTSEAAKRVRETVLGMNEAVNAISDKVSSILTANTEVFKTIERMAGAVTLQRKSTDRIKEAAQAVRSQTDAFEQGIQTIRNQADSLYTETVTFVNHISAEPGVTENEIRFGQSAPFSGPAASLGLGIRDGIELAFKEAEHLGGIYGRRAVLIPRDDRYDPDTALSNVRDFVREGDVFGLVGAVGTPTSRLSERIARGGCVPFVGPVTGAGILRQSASKHVVNIRASYAREADALVAHAHSLGKLKKPALFYQADAYGFAVRDALERPLAAKGTPLEVLAPYDRKTGDVSQAVATIVAEKPDTVFMAGTADTTARFVKDLLSNGASPELLTISFVNADALGPMLKGQGANLVVSQVVPLPNDPGSALVRKIQDLNKSFKVTANVGFSVIEGYVIGRTICEVLRASGEKPTRASFLSSLFSRQSKIGVEDYVLEFGPCKNSGSDRVYLSRMVSDGSFSALSPANNRAAAA